jgi:hypothetical protein
VPARGVCQGRLKGGGYCENNCVLSEVQTRGGLKRRGPNTWEYKWSLIKNQKFTILGIYGSGRRDRIRIKECGEHEEKDSAP